MYMEDAKVTGAAQPVVSCSDNNFCNNTASMARYIQIQVLYLRFVAAFERLSAEMTWPDMFGALCHTVFMR